MPNIAKWPGTAFKISAISLAINGNVSLSTLASKLQIPLAELWRWRRDFSQQVVLRPLTDQETNEALAKLSNVRVSGTQDPGDGQKVIVYTVVIGPINCLSKFEPERGVQYVLFTDDLSTPAPDYWKKVLLNNPERLPHRRLSRKPKLQPHLFLEPHDISVYLAQAIVLRGPLLTFVLSCVAQHSIAVHPDSRGGYLCDTSDDSIKWAVDDGQQLLDQLERYRKEGFVDETSVIDDHFIVRRNTDTIRSLNDFWWNEYIHGSEREQLALAYGLWKQGVTPELLRQDPRQNSLFIRPQPYACNQVPPPKQRRYRGGRQNKGLVTLISHLPTDVRMVEIGSASGESAAIFATSGKINRMWCVDKWNETSVETEYEFDIVRSNHAAIIGKCKMKSELAASYFSPQSMDFVYIDAAHAYEHISKDISLWRPKIKPGGMIGGHDYTFKFRGVIRAIYEAFGRPTAVFEDGSWLVKLPTDAFGIVTYCPKQALATLESVIDSWVNNSGASEIVVYTDGTEPESAVKPRNNVRFVRTVGNNRTEANGCLSCKVVAMEEYFKSTFHGYFVYLESDCWVRAQLTDAFCQMVNDSILGTRPMSTPVDRNARSTAGPLFFRHGPVLQQFFQLWKDQMVRADGDEHATDCSILTGILHDAFDGLYPFRASYVSEHLYDYSQVEASHWLDDIELIQPKIVSLANNNFRDKWIKRAGS